MTSSQPITAVSRWPHRWAVLLVCATFPLIWVGGMVTTYQAGMAVPDWPSTYGFNLLLYPWQTWLFGPFDLLIEHGHRLLGALVGLISIALALSAWRGEPRRGARWLALLAAPAVIAQGLLGGMRVIQDEVLLARVHGCTGPAFFALAVAIATITSRAWIEGPSPRRHAEAGPFQRLAFATTLLAYLQLVAGAHLRHVSPLAGQTGFRLALVFHLLLAAALAVYVLLVWRRTRLLGERALSNPAAGLALLLVAQLGLGVATWVVNYGWPVWFRGHAWSEGYTVAAESMSQALLTTAHVANGSLILGLSLCLTLRSMRFLSPVASAARIELRMPLGVMA